MKVTLDMPLDADGWDRYDPEEFVSEMVPEYVEATLRTGTIVRARFGDVVSFNITPEVLGISLQAGGYTMPQTDMVSLSADDGAECSIVMDGEPAARRFCGAVEYADTDTWPGGTTLYEVTLLNEWETPDGVRTMSVTFNDGSNYTVPGWTRTARDSTGTTRS